MQWEKSWGGCANWANWLGQNTHLPYICAVLYVIVVFGLRDFVMPKLQPFRLKIALALWNLGLCLFSVYGATRTVPVLFGLIYNQGFLASVCNNTAKAWCESNAGLWVFLFIVSKIPELVDTLFLALRKKPIILLHWYHHITVMIYCWYAGYLTIMTGLWFAAMNLCVHSVMYFYYFLQALDIRFMPGKPITIFQISQMIMGVYIACVTAYQYKVVGKCEGHTETNIYFALAMYFSYLVLFVQLFVDSYIRKGKGGKKSQKEE
jgi:hypothetical protein